MHANARIDDIKRFEDGTLYIEVYAEERLLSDLPAKNGLNYLNMYVRKDNYLERWFKISLWSTNNLV